MTNTSTQLRSQILETLRHRLITMHYRPGEVINMDRVRLEFGCSRSPVLHAFDRLAFDNMVDIAPRIGVIVKPLTAATAFCLTEARLNNERQCARLAVERATRADLDAMLVEAARAKDILPHDLSAFVVHDRAFHQAVARATHNPALEEIVQRLHDQILRFFFLEKVNLEKAQSIHDEHSAIAAAIEARDADLAERLMSTHIETRQREISISPVADLGVAVGAR